MEVPRTTSGGPVFDQVGRFFDKTVALCSLELVNEHSNRRQWAQPKSVGAWSIFAPLFSFHLVRHSQHLTNDTVMILPISIVLPC